MRACPRCRGQRYELYTRPCNLYRIGFATFAKLCGLCSGTGSVMSDPKSLAAGDSREA